MPPWTGESCSLLFAGCRPDALLLFGEVPGAMDDRSPLYLLRSRHADIVTITGQRCIPYMMWQEVLYKEGPSKVWQVSCAVI